MKVPPIRKMVPEPRPRPRQAAMLFMHPMWDSESERLGKKHCTPAGYRLHVLAENIGGRKTGQSKQRGCHGRTSAAGRKTPLGAPGPAAIVPRSQGSVEYDTL